MRSFMCFFLGCAVGGAAGAYISKIICDKKAEDKIEEATRDARDYYQQRIKQEEKKVEQKAEEKANETMTRIYGRTYSVYEEPSPREDPNDETNAYEIDAEEFGEDVEYTTYSLDLYADGNLVDETGNVVDDPIHLVGGDILDKVTRSNPVAYVRNDITKTDYEVCFVDADFEEPGGVKD